MTDPNQPTLVHELYLKMRDNLLRPQTIVTYTREPFVYKSGNVRVTIDSEIRTGLRSTDFLSDDPVTVPATDEILLEVKYDEYLPAAIRDLIQLGDTGATAFSKYAVCRRFD